MFTPGSSIALAAVHKGSVALLGAVNAMSAGLENLGRDQDQAWASGKTSPILRGQSGIEPQTYIDDKAFVGR